MAVIMAVVITVTPSSLIINYATLGLYIVTPAHNHGEHRHNYLPLPRTVTIQTNHLKDRKD